MKGNSTWSYRPYCPPLADVGDIYICRVAPGAHRIHFEWLPVAGPSYDIFVRKRGEGEFAHVGKTCETSWNITGLQDQTDYEFYVQSGSAKSRIRLARTGEAVGIVVNYLHPEDEAYDFAGRYLCSPSLLRHPEGYLLASMDLFGGGWPRNLTLIFRSDDDGETWHYVSELMPCFWAKLFLHNGDIYALACSTAYGDLLIGRSSDGGKTFTAPVCLLRGSNGKNDRCGFHKCPQNILRHQGRIYETLEWGNWKNTSYGHAALVMSCSENDDLLVPENWSFTDPVKFDPSAPELQGLAPTTPAIEGTLAVDPQGHLLNIMRFHVPGKALVYRVDPNDPEAPLRYERLMDFPANQSKFTIQYDPVSRYYYTLACRLLDPAVATRNLLSLMRSPDLIHWETVRDVIDFQNEDPHYWGFQYVDFIFEGDDILFLCRTAMNCPHNYHDSNYSTFHRIPNFRTLITPLDG